MAKVEKLIAGIRSSIKYIRSLTTKRLGSNNPSEIAKILPSIDINARRKLLDIDTIDKEINTLLTILEEIKTNADDVIVRKALAAKYDKAMKELDNAIALINYFKQLNKLHAQHLGDPTKTLTTETTLLKRYETYKEHMLTDLENSIKTAEPELKRLTKQPSYIQTGLAKTIILLMGAIAPSCAAETKEEIKIEQPAEHQHTREFYSNLTIEQLKLELENHPTSQGYVILGDKYGEFYNAEKNSNKKKEYLTEFEAVSNKAVELDPKNAGAHNNLGFAYAEKKEYNNAEKEYKYALQLEPKSVFTHTNMGILVWERDKNKEAALDWFNKVLEINKDDNVAKAWISYLKKK